VNVVDSSAWLSYFAGERNAEVFAQPIAAFDNLLVPSITLTEVFKTVVHQRDEHVAAEVIAQMKRGHVISLDESLAVEAADCGLQFGLLLADSIIYATARKFGAVVWTQDVDFVDLPNVRYFANR
jgi:predicted nucleic acid-binding protein